MLFAYCHTPPLPPRVRMGKKIETQLNEAYNQAPPPEQTSQISISDDVVYETVTVN